MSDVERLSIAKLRFAGGKEHDVNYVSEVHYDAALAREAALREELAKTNAAHAVAAQNHGVLNAEIFNLQERLRDREDRYNREVLGLSNEGDPIGGDPAGGYKNDNARLQQRLTVAEQRAGELEELLRECQPALDKAGYSTWQIDEALKPAAELECAQGLPGTSGMRLNMLANQGE